jgi:hypothetical protein
VLHLRATNPHNCAPAYQHLVEQTTQAALLLRMARIYRSGPVIRPLVLLTFIALAVLPAGRAIQGPFRSTTITSLLPQLQLRELQSNKTGIAEAIASKNDSDPEDPWTLDPDDEEEDSSAPTLTPEQQEAIWCKAKSRGVKLIKAMMMNDAEAQTMLSWPYIQSPWDGDLRTDLRTWGYNDNDEKHQEVDDQCDFDKTHEMSAAFSALKVDARSAGQGGPNHCFYTEHMNGPTVIRDEDGDLPFEEDQHYIVNGRDYQVLLLPSVILLNFPIDTVYDR